MSKKYSIIYEDILDYIKSKGYKVYHRKQPKDTGGTYDIETLVIEIDPKYRNTKVGIYYLLHEWGHACDHREGKFKWFFNSKASEKYTKEKMDEVFLAEKSASIRANREAKLRGIYNCYAVELDEDQKSYLEEFYRKRYFIN